MDILFQRYKFMSGKIKDSQDNINKCISIVASQLHRFDYNPLQTLCLRTLVSGQDILACLPTGYRESLVYQCWPSLCSLLAKERYGQWEDDAIILVISPFLELRLMVGHIMFVVVPPVRLFPVETHSMKCTSPDPAPCNMTGRNTFEVK